MRQSWLLAGVALRVLRPVPVALAQVSTEWDPAGTSTAPGSPTPLKKGASALGEGLAEDRRWSRDPARARRASWGPSGPRRTQNALSGGRGGGSLGML